MTSQAYPATPAARLPLRITPLLALGVLAAIVAVLIQAERIWIALATPLWLDETWTGSIATAPTWPDFWRDVTMEVNPPLYYLFMRFWVMLFGDSNIAMRIPGLVGILVAAALPVLAPPKGAGRLVSWTWAGLIFAWWGCGQFLDARCYALLMALSVGQALVFAGMIRTPSLGRAALWCGLTALAILCHYYALFIGAAQGLIYLGLCRWRAVRTWPALIMFAPTVGWMVHHAARLSQYGGQDVAWHPALDAFGVVSFASFTLGGYSLALSGLALVVLALVGLAPRRAGMTDPQRSPPPAGWTSLTQEDAGAPWIAAASGLIALAVVLATGLMRPTLTPRYLLPEVPAILLGLALCAAALPRARMTCAALVALYAAFALNPAGAAAKIRNPSPYGLDLGAQFLMAHGVTDVVLVCDHPVAKIADLESLKRFGAYLFRRAGSPARVVPLVVAEHEDANLSALKAARGSRPGIIWMYNRDDRTAARSFAPDIARRDPRWSCLNVGDGVIGHLACYRAAP